MPNFRNLLRGRQEENESTFAKLSKTFSLSFKHRMIGFCICAAIAALFAILSCAFIPTIIVNPAGFAVMYTIGNLGLIGSTFFLVGPLRQLKLMFKPVRITTSLIFLASIGFTLYFAIGLHSWILSFLFIGIQFAALIVYILSYIPFARQACLGCWKSLCCRGGRGNFAL
eukprot:gnl/Trimastix_PCT/4017.p1 GENE.gnl/Trimastix_PCT/4017~~gnl/Trimastix_PCT/4017.p1  ORF type:complete len:170 (+),score=27.31 gnl/Trimastix_PCT/4017:199-708(+)